MSTKLDQIVKGAAPPSAHIPEPILGTTGVHPSDPTLHLPSSPPQIYLNLLILEASLRSQYLELRARRRQHTFFLSLLTLWIGYFTYALFLAEREDGQGKGGSVYWVVEVAEKLALGGGVVTALLVWGTGQWERGVRWPRRWLGTTNRGLRGFNCKVVVVRRRWYMEWAETLGFFIKGGLLHNNGSSTYRVVPPSLMDGHRGGPPNTRPLSRSEKGGSPGLPNIDEHPTKGQEEDLSPGGDSIQLLLLPKPFSPQFREAWDEYRTEYWQKENERRKVLLKKIKAYEKAERRKISWWKRWFWPSAVPATDPEKHGHHHHHHHSKSHLSVPGEKRLRSGSVRSGSHSRTSSRSSTPLGKDEHFLTEGEPRGHSRRSSTASTRSSKPRTSSSLTPTGSIREKEGREKGTGVSGRTRGSSVRTHSGKDGRPGTPDAAGSDTGYKRRSLIWDGTEGTSRKRDSFMSDASTESARDELRQVKKEDDKKAEEVRKEETAKEEVRREQIENIAQRVREKAKITAKLAAGEALKKDSLKEQDVKP